MERLSLLQLSSPKSEFYEPASSADPILFTSYELNSGCIALVQENSFSGRDCENPYHHQNEFEQVCLLALLSLNELLRKRTEMDVAFTKEYTWDIESKEW